MPGLDPRGWPIAAPASMQLANIVTTVISKAIFRT